MSQLSLFSSPAKGTCLFCSSAEPNTVIAPTIFSSIDRKLGPVGVCDVCSYALRHAWQRAQGERIAAVSPHLVRTYVLVPRLPKDREPIDVSAYEFLVDGGGGLPHVEFPAEKGPRSLGDTLLRQYAVTTWRETMRPCYLGYSGSADFSEVLLVWAWGKSLAPAHQSPGSSFKFATFAALLGKPTPDAGFYLGIKAAFESLLWKHEVDPESNLLSVVMREPAMRYLRFKQKELGQLGASDASDMDDTSMMDLCRATMTTEERAVASLLENASKPKPSHPLSDLKKRGEAPTTGTEGNQPEGDDGEGASEGDSGGPEDDQGEDDQSAGATVEGTIEPGFARPKHSLDR